MLFLSACRAAAELCVLPARKKCRTDWLSLAVSLLRISVSFYIAFWRGSLLLLLSRRCQSIICKGKKKNQTLSLILSCLLYISLPTALENVKLNSSSPPSSQLSLAMINLSLCYLGKTKSPSFDEFCCCTNLADNLHFPLKCHLNLSLTQTDCELVRQKLLCCKMNSCSQVNQLF